MTFYGILREIQEFPTPLKSITFIAIIFIWCVNKKWINKYKATR